MHLPGRIEIGNLRRVIGCSIMFFTVINLGCDPELDSTGIGGLGLETPVSAYQFPEDQDPVMAKSPFVDTEILVQPYPGADTQALESLYFEAGAVILTKLEAVGIEVLRVPSGRLYSVAAQLGQSPMVERLQKNYVLIVESSPNDSHFARQEYLSAIDAPSAWDLSVGDPGILIAIVDTGIDGTHPDLKDRLVPGWNVFDGNEDSNDVQGHGTAVAGIVGAVSDNHEGIAGMTWNSPILPIKVTDPTGKSSSRYVAAGILRALAQGAKVINVSFAPLWSDRVVQATVEQAYHRGALVVISAGNGGTTATASGYVEGVFVAATDSADKIAHFSDRGPFVDFSAPGTGIWTTALGGGYTAVDGTSFSAPIISGTAALLWSANANLRPSMIVRMLAQSATDLGAPGFDAVYGHGMVNAGLAVPLAVAASVALDSQPPSVTVVRPKAGTEIGTQSVALVSALDGSGVSEVLLSVDGAPWASDSVPPYQFVIDPQQFSTGIHELAFAASDDLGNTSSPQRVKVTIRPPSSSPWGEVGTVLTFLSPKAGSTVTGDVTIRASISDPDGLALVEWLVDGKSVFSTPLSGTTSGVSYVWRSSRAPAGRHAVTIVAMDVGGFRTSAQLELHKK